jgi:hypothetical protein
MGQSSWSASLHVRALEHDTPVILICNGLNKTESGSYKDIFLLLLLEVSSLKSTPPLLTVLIMLTSSNKFMQLSQTRLGVHFEQNRE